MIDLIDTQNLYQLISPSDYVIRSILVFMVDRHKPQCVLINLVQHIITTSKLSKLHALESVSFPAPES